LDEDVQRRDDDDADVLGDQEEIDQQSSASVSTKAASPPACTPLMVVPLQSMPKPGGRLARLMSPQGGDALSPVLPTGVTLTLAARKRLKRRVLSGPRMGSTVTRDWMGTICPTGITDMQLVSDPLASCGSAHQPAGKTRKVWPKRWRWSGWRGDLAGRLAARESDGQGNDWMDVKALHDDSRN
jgi:hypothetical protein